MSNPLVSICIPTFRGAAFISDTIDSVLNQSYPHFELWILDDNSPDDTQAIVSRYTDPRIKYERYPINAGPEKNWNRCLEKAQGKYFKLLPHDDLLSVNCLEEQVAILEPDTAEEIALVFGSRQIIDSSGRVLMKRGLPMAAGRIAAPNLIKKCVRSGTNLIGEPGNALFRRSLTQKIGPYDASHPYLVDLDYWFRVLMHGDAHYTRKTSSSFRVCAGSWSVAIGSQQYRDFKEFLDKYFSDRRFNISAFDRMLGLIRARMNTVIRAVIYGFLFSKNNKSKREKIKCRPK